MSAPFVVVPAEPIGTTKGVAFVTRRAGCGVEAIETPHYPESREGRDLRAFRVARQVGLGDAARALGFASVATYSDLERGHARFVDPEDWGRAKALIAEVKTARRP